MTGYERFMSDRASKRDKCGHVHAENVQAFVKHSLIDSDDGVVHGVQQHQHPAVQAGLSVGRTGCRALLSILLLAPGL